MSSRPPAKDRGSDQKFERVLEAFKASLTEEEKKNFEITTLHDVQRLLLGVQKELRDSKTMCNLRRIQGFLEVMEDLSKIIEIARNSLDAFDTILGAYERLGDAITMLSQYQDVFNHSSQMTDQLVSMYQDILEFHQAAKNMISGRGARYSRGCILALLTLERLGWRRFFKSTWKTFETRFGGILKRLEHRRNLIKEQALLSSYAWSQERDQQIRDALKSLHSELTEQQKLLKDKEKETKNLQYRTVVNWIAAPAYTREHRDFCDIRRHHPETGKWILDHNKVKNWRDSTSPESSTLWINGIPGAGKTILASSIISDCIEKSTFHTAYFYCRESDPTKNTSNDVLRGIIAQLLMEEEEFVPFCYENCLKSAEPCLRDSNVIQYLLESLCDRIQRLNIIVDGLDECALPEWRNTVHILGLIVAKGERTHPGKIRLLFLSQDYEDIKKTLKTATILRLDTENIQKDIERYVLDQLSRIRTKFDDLSNEQAERIEKLTCRGSKGMFLFAKLVLDNLWSQPTMEHLNKEIEDSTFPSKLYEAYDRILVRMKKSLSPNQWLMAWKLLGWMLCAKRPLKWRELNGVISIDLENHKFLFKEKRLRDHVRDLCGSLIHHSDRDSLEFVHNTARRYLQENKHLSLVMVEVDLTILCLRYMTFECFDKHLDEAGLCEYAIGGYFVLQDYAVANWFKHFRAMIDSSKDVYSLLSGRLARDPQQIYEPQNVSTLQGLGATVDEFMFLYDDCTCDDDVVKKEAEPGCEPFSNLGWHELILSLWTHILAHQTKGSSARNNISIESLSKVIERNRQLLESLDHSALGLSRFYGDRPFKCPKLTCYYFYEGFTDAKSRDKHKSRHDRPFICEIEGCSAADFGFVNGKDLEKHMRFYHPEEADASMLFTGPPKEAKSEKIFACTLCAKKFTRNYHLRSHILNHTGERPFPCPECGKAFTRENDCRRHRKIHDRRK